MSAVLLVGRVVQWAVRIQPASQPQTPWFPEPEEITDAGDIESLRRIDDLPASPDPVQKPQAKPTPSPTPTPKPQEQPQPFDQDKKTCQLLAPTKELSEKLATQVVIARNCEQAMRDAYNRGYATGRAVSKKWKSRCPRIRADGQYLAGRLKRILLQQDNGPRRMRKVSSRND